MTCVNRKNLNELPQIFNLLVNLGVKRWRVSNVFPKGRAKDNPLFQLSNEKFRQVFEFIREAKTKKIINVNYDCEGFLGSYEKVVRDNPFFCWAGVNIGAIVRALVCICVMNGQKNSHIAM